MSLNKSIHILLILLMPMGLVAQDSVQTLGGTVKEFYMALQDSSATSRTSRLSALLLPEARMNSVMMREKTSANIALGDLNTFLSKSAEFYQTFDINLDEFDRSVDYYADLASVNSMIKQTVTNSAGRQFEQMVWYALDLVYKDGRWYIAHATWTSIFGPVNSIQPVEADTLWHRIESR